MQEIKDRLGAELKTLEHEYRVLLPREIGDAVAMGDLRENAEYHAALERQRFVKARIGELRERLASLNSINMSQVPQDKVGLGSSVTLDDLDTGDEVSYELVVPEVADLKKGLISIASPIGKSLVGLSEGDEVTVEIPSGHKRFELIALRTIHDKDSS